MPRYQAIKPTEVEITVRSNQEQIVIKLQESILESLQDLTPKSDSNVKPTGVVVSLSDALIKQLMVLHQMRSEHFGEDRFSNDMSNSAFGRLPVYQETPALLDDAVAYFVDQYKINQKDSVQSED